MSRVMVVVALALLVGDSAGSSLRAQDVGSGQGDRGPRFMLASAASSTPVLADPARVALLRMRVSADLRDTTIEGALGVISAQTGIQFVYSADVVPARSRTSLRANGISVAAALTEVLLDADVDVVLSGNQAALVRRIRTVARQVGSISGTVRDATTQGPLADVNISLERTRSRATTDEQGRYRIAGLDPGSYVLVARRLGYAGESRTVTVTDGVEADVDVKMRQLLSALQEVVVTATGEQRRLELGHVVGRINADSLVKEAPVSSLSELLTARVPGLQVFQSQGTVGGKVQLQIRGRNSLYLGTEPMVIVDGVRYTSATEGNSRGPFGVEPTSRLNDLNPNDIETVEVVKGPSAATLYGTGAANGVLVITTKRGRPGPARWNAYARGTRNEIPTAHFPDSYWGWNSQFPTVSCNLVSVAVGACTQDSITVLRSPLNDPGLTLFGSKPYWEYGANVAGGQQDFRYYFSGDYEDATGPVQMPPAIAEQLRQQRGLSELPEEWREPNAFTKLNLRANVTAVLGDKTDLRVNTGYVHSATRAIGMDWWNSPYAWAAFTGGPTSPYGYGEGGTNPANAFAQSSTERTDRFFGNASGQWQPLPWLAMRGTVGLDLASSNRYSLHRRGDGADTTNTGTVGDERLRELATSAELGATATLRRGRLSSRTSVGAQYVRNLTDGLSSTGLDLPPGGTSVGEAAIVGSGQSYAETVTLGSYLEETLGFNERLFLTGALRVDGASAFGQDYDAAAYPKVSASWLVSEEPFLPRLPGLEELRLRYAYGASGQQPTSRMARPHFFAERTIENGTTVHIIGFDELGNPTIRPERVREHELGLDATALDSRLRLGLTWYRRRTADQIVVVDLPPGLGAIYTNLGLTTQRGFEAELTARVLDTRLLSWDLTLQHGVHRTKLVDLGNGFAFPSAGGSWKEGYPLGARFQRPLLGYADANGDGILAGDEVQLGDTAIYVGESTPPRTQTLTTVLGLFERRLRLSALLERRTGFTQINQLRQTQCRELHACRAVVDPSTPLVEQAQVQVGDLPEPADFTRLREVTAALDLPVGLARGLRMRSTTLALSVRNLALWTDFSGPDPESASLGFGSMGIPQGRSWTLRLDLGL